MGILTSRVTVTKVVPPHWAAPLLAGTVGAGAADTTGETTVFFPPAAASDLVPSRATDVKLEKP